VAWLCPWKWAHSRTLEPHSVESGARRGTGMASFPVSLLPHIHSSQLFLCVSETSEVYDFGMYLFQNEYPSEIVAKTVLA
jgi:hypothetical protein